MELEGKKVVLFDGVCNLCNDAVNFIIKHDHKDVFRYASLQSEIGQQLAAARAIDATKLDTILLILPETTTTYYHKSTAALQIAKQLSGGYPFLSVFLLIPKTVRDYIYDVVSRNRYKWFGKKSSCTIPTPELKALFIDQP